MGDRASILTYFSGGSAFVCGLGVNEVAAIVGASVGVLTFFANLWFKSQHLAIARATGEADRG